MHGPGYNIAIIPFACILLHFKYLHMQPIYYLHFILFNCVFRIFIFLFYLLYISSFTGFMQPTVAIAMLNVDDYDGWNDRHPLILCPKPVKAYFQDLIPRPEDTICLGQVLLHIRDSNADPTNYTLSPEAADLFKAFYNEAVDHIHGVSNTIMLKTLSLYVTFPQL